LFFQQNGTPGITKEPSLEQMGDVQDAIAAPLDHFELVIEAFHKAARVSVQKVVGDLVKPGFQRGQKAHKAA